MITGSRTRHRLKRYQLDPVFEQRYMEEAKRSHARIVERFRPAHHPRSLHEKNAFDSGWHVVPVLNIRRFPEPPPSKISTSYKYKDTDSWD